MRLQKTGNSKLGWGGSCVCAERFTDLKNFSKVRLTSLSNGLNKRGN